MYGNLPARVTEAYNDLCAKQTAAMNDPQTATFEAPADVLEHWHHISGIEEQFFYHKSRIQWLDLGDRNTRFYHKVTQTRNASNTIRRIITADGSILTDLQDIKKEASSHFENFLQGVPADFEAMSHEQLQELIDYRCPTLEGATLVAPVQADKIKEALFSIPTNKAPEPDGFPMDFFKAAWSIIGKDFITAIQSFLYGFLPKSVNATLLSLVPKTTTADRMSDFRPIACCSVIYKFISRIIARRLKATLPEATELNQCTFVEGRLLHENVLLATS